MVIGSTPNSETGCVRSSGSWASRESIYVKEDFQYHWIKRASLLAAHQFERLFARVARAMRAVCCKRFVAIDDSQYSRPKRNILTL